jgi:4-hydroxybenzoate-CoA ligase
MTALRDYNAAVDFVDCNVAEGGARKTAFIDPSRNITYGELREAAARIGPMLARMGLEPENRIALVLLDTVDFPVLFWGAIRAGIIPLLLNTRLTPDQYRYLLDDSRAKAVFVSAALLPAVHEAARDVPALRSEIVRAIAELPAKALAECKACIAAAGRPGRDGYGDELKATRRLFLDADTRRRVEAFLRGTSDRAIQGKGRPAP